MSKDDFSDLSLDIDFSAGDKTKPGERRKPISQRDKLPKRPLGRPSKASLEKEAKDSIEAFIALCSLAFSSVCVECSTTLIQSADAIAAPAASIAMRNPKLLEWLNKGGDAIDWFKLAAALAQPTRQVWLHHFASRKEEEIDAPVNSPIG